MKPLQSMNRRKPWTNVIDVLMTIFVALGGAATAAGFGGDMHWLLDSFSHFRAQYAVILLIAAAGVLVRKRWGFAIATVCLAGVNLWVVLPHWTAPAPSMPAGPDLYRLRILHANVMAENVERDAMVDLIRQEQADIVTLSEIDEAWVRAVSPVLASYSHRKVVPSGEAFGIGLWSRIPLQSIEVVNPGKTAFNTLFAKLTVMGRPVTIVATHLPPPVHELLVTERLTWIDSIAPLAPPEDEDLILIGDLNTTSWSIDYRDITSRLQLRDSRAGQGLQPSWPVRSPWLLIPIDHILVRGQVRVAERHLGPDVGSDHFPVIAEMVWAGSPDQEK